MNKAKPRKTKARKSARKAPVFDLAGAASGKAVGEIQDARFLKWH
jgi:hypothetical protein